MTHLRSSGFAVVSLCLVALAACSGSEDSTGPDTNAGASANGGTSGATGDAGKGGSSTGGTSNTGGAAGSGVGAGNGGGSGSSATGGSGGTGGSASGGTGGTGGTGGSASGGTGGTGGTGGSSGGPASGGDFRYGVNYGHLNGAWGDADDASLAARAGCTSARVKLPEVHLDKWGYDIEVGDMQSYTKLGLVNHVAFLTTPTADHSTMPGGQPDWQLEYYKPKNLYEPVFLPSGEVNPDNYWAAFVYKTVSTYKSYVHIWQVWNEPDWTPDWKVTQKWSTEAPKAADLPRFNGSIFEYVRMLRVTREAAKKADPSARIAVGGLGYPSFLGALLRYTDEPNTGAVSADYPEKGGAYFDVLDYHCYPVFSPGSSDVGVDGFVKLKQDMAAELTKAGVSGKTWNVTETGAPREAIGDAPGGVEYARSYLAKVMVRAQAEGIGGVDWFLLGDVDSQKDSFGRMGLFLDYTKAKKPDDAALSETGKAYATLSKTLGKARFDAAATTALGASGDAQAFAFTGDGPRKIVAWARTKGTSESASATLSVTSAAPLARTKWDGSVDSLAPAGGAVTVSLDGSPVVLAGP